MVTWLIDISNHQGAFPVPQAVAEGYRGVICKTSEGTSYRDPYFDQFTAAAIGAGAVPGGYHFLRGGSGAQQARILYNRLRAHGGPTGFLAVCDNESDAGWADTVAFASEWAQISGGHPLIMYSGAWWWQQRGWPGADLTPYLWHSRYVSASGYGSTLYDTVPASWWTPGYGGWSTATILQFSASATVAGRSPIDVNAFRGTIDDLRALTRPVAGGTGMIGGPMAGETADWAASHVDSPTPGPDMTGAHVALSEIWAIVQRLEQRPPAAVTLTDDQVRTLRDGLAGEVASLLAPQLRVVTQLAERLGDAGDTLGTLNDDMGSSSGQVPG